jgi:hypothetical protein
MFKFKSRFKDTLARWGRACGLNLFI